MIERERQIVFGARNIALTACGVAGPVHSPHVQGQGSSHDGFDSVRIRTSKDKDKDKDVVLRYTAERLSSR